MTKRFFVFLIPLVFSFGAITNVKKLQWIDPYGRKPLAHSVWCKGLGIQEGETRIGKIYEKTIRQGRGVVDVVVNAQIYPDIISEINTFALDLMIAGYSVQVDTISGMSHTILRSYLAGISGLLGAIFVGETPVAWFETNGFGNWEEFPHDLYFCDLNGTYVDSDADGIYDNHTGSVAPEIWVGRIYARNLTWDNEIRLLKNYFRKNHLYRVDSLMLPDRGLSFVDDDWSYWGSCYLNLIYSNVVVITDNYQTTATNYRNQLTQGYEWIHICSHSSPWGHTFMYGSSQYRGTVFNYEIFSLEPHALFYNLFACSGTRFVEENSSAGWYLFVDPYGLLAIGSTKTGSMLYFDDFYGPIGQQNVCIGDAFKSWFSQWGETDWDWFYGMNILGDPTLKPRHQYRITNQEKMSSHVQYVRDWEPPEIIAPDPESDGFPKIVTNTDSKVWVVWESGRSYTNGRSEIYGAYRDAGGWSSAMNIGPFYYWDYNPVIGIDNQNRPVAVWAGWENLGGNYQYDIFYSIYSGSWSARQMLHVLDPAFDLKPSLAKDQIGRLWVSWESRRDVNSNIYTSYFNGSVWSTPQPVTTNPADETTPEMVVDNIGQPWVFYCRRFADYSEIWGSYYNGSQWIESGPISNNQTMVYRPSGAVDRTGRICVVWQTNDLGNPDIYASYFNGTNWSTPQRITMNIETDLFGDLTADTNGVLWLVFQSKVGGDWNIYSVYCRDSTWGTPEIVANLSGADINPQIACSNTNELWVCWQGYSTGNWEIMVTHRPGIGIDEETERPTEHDFRIAPTLFSKTLRLNTIEPHQEIKIYDAKGALIQTIFSDRDKTTTWSPADMPSGIYFVVLKVKDSILTKKVLLVK